MWRTITIGMIGLLLFGLALMAFVAPARSGQRNIKGPFSPEAWPPTIDTTKKAHYVSVDNSFSSPGPNWTPL